MYESIIIDYIYIHRFEFTVLPMVFYNHNINQIIKRVWSSNQEKSSCIFF